MTFRRRLVFSFALIPLAFAPADLLARGELGRASQSLSEASMALPVGSVALLEAGATFSVVALTPVAEGVELALEASTASGRISLVVASELVETASITVGIAVTAVAVSGGFVLWSGSQALAFVADASLAPYVHRRELHRDRPAGRRTDR